MSSRAVSNEPRPVYVLKTADALGPGQEAWFSERILRAAFGDDVEKCDSLEAAIFSHPIGHFRLHKQGRGYVLIRKSAR